MFFCLFLLAECSYEAAIFCLPGILDIVGECVNSPNIEACIMDVLGNDNACIFCVCAALELINLSCWPVGILSNQVWKKPIWCA